ncbi:5746_t:CDS:1, partial [Ambispora gerdemannii]
FHGLKIMKNAFELTRMTANDLWNIMKVIIFVLDDLYETSEQ